MIAPLLKFRFWLGLIICLTIRSYAQEQTGIDSLLANMDNPDRLPESVILMLSERVSMYEEPEDRALIHDRIAFAYLDAGPLDSAAAHAWHVLRLVPENRALCSRAYLNLGFVAIRKEAYERAADFYEQAFSRCDELKDKRGMLVASAQLGRIDLKRARFVEARDQYQRAIELSTQLGDSATRHDLVFEMATVFRMLGNADRAKDLLQQSLRNSQSDSVRRADIYAEIGRVEESKGEYRRAIRAYSTSRVLGGKQSVEAKGLEGLARMYFQLNVLDTASRYADSLESTALRQGDAVLARDCFRLRYQLAEKAGDTARAYNYHVRYHLYDDTVRRREADRRVQNVRDELILGAHEASVRTAELEMRLKQTQEAQENQWKYFLVILGGAAALVVLFVFLWYRTRMAMEERVEERTAKIGELEARNQKLFTVIAHDLQGPVSTFNNLTRSIASQLEKGTPEERVELLRHLHATTMEVKHALNELLDWAVVQSGAMAFRPEVFNCMQLAKAIEEDLRPVAEEHAVTIHFLIPERSMAYADRAMIRVVLRSLVYRAICASPEGEVITLFSGTKDDLMTLGVKDNGTPIPEERMRRLLQGGSDSEEPRGSGVGLPLCADLARKNGGDLFAEPGPNGGNTFYLTLPEHASG